MLSYEDNVLKARPDRLLVGHTQKEHETSHGSMAKTRWAIDGPDGTVLELDGRKFGANDDGAPMLVRIILSAADFG